MKKLLIIFMFTIFSLLLPAQNNYSVLTGKVTLEGNPLPGVTLVLSSPKIMGTRNAVTDANGVYRYTLLPPGSGYEFYASMPSFQPFVRKNITLSLGNTTTIDFELNESTIKEEIVVTAEAPMVDTTTSQSATNLSDDFIQSIANDRQYQMIMAMMPGTVEGNNPSMLGGSSSDNIYLVDGADTTDPLTHTWGAAMNFDTIAEVQLVTTGVSAEHGRAMGAVANMVTKSGSNEFSGNLRYVKSDVSWNSEFDGKPFDEAVKYTTEDRVAFTLGGPIMKDKLWFFLSYETRGKEKSTFHWGSIEDYRSQDESRLVQEAPKYEGHYVSFKLTYQLNSDHSFVAMYQEDPIDFPLYSYLNYTEYIDPTQTKREQGGDRVFFEWNWVTSPSSFLSFKYQQNSGPLNNVPAGADGGLDNPVMRYSVAEFGGYVQTAVSSSSARYLSTREFDSYKLTYSKFFDTGMGSHDLKAGIDWRDSTYGSYSYPYGDGYYMRFREDYERYGEGGYLFVYDYDAVVPALTQEDYSAFYVQDSWSLTEKLTLDLGLRSESLALKNSAGLEIVSNSYGDMISPRLGFAYEMDGDKLYGSVARYYDAIGNWVVTNNQPGQEYTMDRYYLTLTVNQLIEMGLDPWNDLNDWAQISDYTNTDNWYYDRTFSYGTPDSEIQQYGNIDPSFMDEFTLGYEKQMNQLYALGVKLVSREWKDTYEDEDFDQDGVWEFVTADGTWREYDALILTAQKKMSDDGFQFLASYTYSETKGISMSDNSSIYLDSPYDYYNWYGKINNYPHVIKFNGSYAFDFGMSVGLNYILSSGSSWTPYVQVMDLIPGSYNEGYYMNAYLTKRGTESLPSWSRADLHLEYEFNLWDRVEMSVYSDIFNVLNKRTAVDIDTFAGYGYYDTTAEPGTQEYLDYITSHAPVLDPDRTNQYYGEHTQYTFPRSYYVGINLKF